MKKLLALLLCLTLFVGILPVSASAEVDLSDAYAALGRLNGAYGQLSAAAFLQGLCDYAVKYAPDPVVVGESYSFTAADIVRMNARLIPYVYDYIFPSGLSYEGLFIENSNTINLVFESAAGHAAGLAADAVSDAADAVSAAVSAVVNAFA